MTRPRSNWSATPGTTWRRWRAQLRAAGRPVASKVLIGPPATSIKEATQPGDVVVLCSHERTGVLRWLMGSVAEQLVRDDEWPVILVPAPESVPAE